jgi:hypothetical protein
MKPHPYREALGEVLVGGLRGDHRRGVSGRNSRREAPLRGEVRLELLRVDALEIGVSDRAARAVNLLENSRSKSMSCAATAWRSSE